ncbi:Glucose-repressible alcohol dehydrogenase transcriptional effector [Tetrabaena socialis]|uniref:Glucose-repressible alcohol dehydrogenase transcriptional effector n=1 Tax=Tetrabaena socialis TaxID=47790 RepID=A0A2J8AKC7_9CHLO|nr:Glucose-repressible alcohol dehydrogenase transcriptional effector [Tetrabaena socialis]|eukprot:PNH12976.1 Glucose-repressible alcohol dehydrogenase transcriptional effector [Tetrabaena socialis]
MAAAGSPGSAAVSTANKVKRTPVILNTPSKPTGAHFRVLQWNVLADGLAQTGGFYRVPPKCLEWEYRKPRLLQEILEADADIICLQELNHFGEDRPSAAVHAGQLLRNVAKTAQRLGSSSCGEKQGSDATGGNGSSSNGTGGTAAGAAGAGALGGGSAANGVHGDGAGAARLHGNGRSNGTGGGGGGAHPRAGVPVLVTGDFNTLPGSKTCRAFREHPLGLLSLWEQPPLDATLTSSDATLTSSTASEAPPPGPSAAPQPAAQRPGPAAPPAPSSALRADAQQQRANSVPAAGDLAGAAAAADSAAGTARAAAAAAAAAAATAAAAEFSTWKFREKGESKRISDYIWFSGCGALRPLQRWRMLTEAEIGPTALPSTSYASDHVSLCCEFEWDVDADLEWAPASAEPEWG